jgi:hypothetical protein
LEAWGASVSVLDWSLVVGIIGVAVTAGGVSGGLFLLSHTRSETRRIRQDLARHAEFSLTVALLSPPGAGRRTATQGGMSGDVLEFSSAVWGTGLT